MKKVNSILMKMVWFPALAILVAGTFLWADDSGLLSKQELKTLITSAKTMQDHERVARHFKAKADELEAEAKEHTELAAQYKANQTSHPTKHPLNMPTAAHCQYLAADLHKAAERARELAADHREMAKQALK